MMQCNIFAQFKLYYLLLLHTISAMYMSVIRHFAQAFKYCQKWIKHNKFWQPIAIVSPWINFLQNSVKLDLMFHCMTESIKVHRNVMLLRQLWRLIKMFTMISNSKDIQNIRFHETLSAYLFKSWQVVRISLNLYVQQNNNNAKWYYAI